MKERPISYSPPMVRARNAGIKSQTRRIMKNQPTDDWQPAHYVDLHAWDKHGELTDRVTGWGPCDEDGDQGYNCPYGQPGQRLWVREAWRADSAYDAVPPRDIPAESHVWYEADGPFQPVLGKSRPPMFMPRWASRGLDEITGVRVERLLDISEADCITEGAPGGHGAIADYSYHATPHEHYRHIWQAINGPGSWAANPWVWVIEFKVIK